MKTMGEAHTTPSAGYFALLRPFTLLAPIIVSSSVMIASLMYSGRTDVTNVQAILLIIPASLCFALLNGASNALNQATDRKEDAISKPYRPIPSGIISHRQAQNIAIILYVASLLLSATVSILFSAFILAISFFSITYSLPPRMKKMLFINQVWVAIPRGLLAILASWSVFGNPFHALPLSMGCIAALFLLGGTATKDILDIEADTRVGTKTLVNVFGTKKAAIISLFFMSSAFFLIIPLALLQIIEIYLLPLSILLVFSFAIWYLMVNSQKNKKYENTSSWTVMYGTYFIFALSFALLTISFS